ncbi:MEDS domain-containing protein [Sphaerisporangium sp. B11E5]|uniref:MEDS domain-containing protein n=1 Tax=Sphaerisporangium sp. B11E5 TaxID=3153563 RepID=UPI00325F6447
MPAVLGGDHRAGVFCSDDAFLSASVHFAREGVGQGALVMVFPAVHLIEEARDRLGGDGTLRAAGRESHVQVLDSRGTQLSSGRFDPARLRRTYATAARDARAAGFSALWVSVDMSWARPDVVDTEALLAFEAGANSLFTPGTLTAVCQYDRRVFSEPQIARACRAHTAGPHTSAWLRHRRTSDGRGLALSGEADHSNRLAWEALMGSLGPGDDVLDVTAMTFLDARSMATLVSTARTHPRRLTVVTCRRHLGLLRLLRAGDHATVEVAGEAP